MQKSLFGLKQTASLPMYLIAVQDLTRKAFIIFKLKMLELKETLYLVYFSHFTDMEIED